MQNQNRGARIRTGDLCDPNAALYRTEPRPADFSTDGVGWAGSADRRTDGVGFEPTRARCPHDFQSCALSRSATRPSLQRREWDGPAPADRLRGSALRPDPLRLEPRTPRPPLRFAPAEGVGWAGSRRPSPGLGPSARPPSARTSNPTPPASLRSSGGSGMGRLPPTVSGARPFGPTPFGSNLEPHARRFASLQRREWDSNPRGPMDQRLSRAPLLAAQPSLRSSPAWARTRTLLIQSQTCCQLHHGASKPAPEPPVGLEPTTPSLRVTCSTS